MFARFALLLIVLFAAGAARGQETAYVNPNWANLLHTMVRFNVLDLSDPDLIDEYGAVEECDLYKTFYTNDFKWNQVRQALRQSAKENAATYPVTYYYTIRLQLDRYDFAAKIFRFTPKTTISNVNSFALFAVEGNGCGAANIKHLPRLFQAVLPTPIYMEGLPLSDQDARTVLQGLTSEGNADRIVYARFGLRITYIAPFRRKPVDPHNSTGPTEYGQGAWHNMRSVRFDAQLENIEFYLDPDMTQLIYKYQM